MPKPRILGEREIIEIIWKQLEKMPRMAVAFGDDVSGWEMEGGRLAVLKADMLVGKTDVPCGMSLWQAARKAVVMNVSDFAAKGVQPLAVLVSLGLQAGIPKRDVVEIARGLNAGAREYGAYVVGGDTGESSDLIVSVSLFGVGEKKTLMLRGGAEVGDVVAVTGLFGKTSAGLKALKGEAKASADLRKALVKSVLMPRARLSEGLALAKSGAVSASVDSSDGLAWSLYELARASRVGFVLDKLPVAGGVEEFARVNRLSLFDLVFYGGEEYELVVTIKPDLFVKAQRGVAKVGGCLIPVGKAVGDKGVFYVSGDGKRRVEARGYEHFRQG
jgi:thiamine-monophosphate kinase